ncbi:unnamed protein product [Polarella glacialis]|uniref:Uncharacterized protein n=1 Tax=Polarella glacialis TaxID=89957 RepID=A0A813FI91_POLGL|nr:unnamed protein product [Polarella glacialis]
MELEEGRLPGTTNDADPSIQHALAKRFRLFFESIQFGIAPHLGAKEQQQQQQEEEKHAACACPMSAPVAWQPADQMSDKGKTTWCQHEAIFRRSTELKNRIRSFFPLIKNDASLVQRSHSSWAYSSACNIHGTQQPEYLGLNGARHALLLKQLIVDLPRVNCMPALPSISCIRQARSRGCVRWSTGASTSVGAQAFTQMVDGLSKPQTWFITTSLWTSPLVPHHTTWFLTTSPGTWQRQCASQLGCLHCSRQCASQLHNTAGCFTISQGGLRETSIWHVSPCSHRPAQLPVEPC